MDAKKDYDYGGSLYDLMGHVFHERLSDNEIFSIGDRNKQPDGTVSQIAGFELKGTAVGEKMIVKLERDQYVWLIEAVKWPEQTIEENKFPVLLIACDHSKLMRFIRTLKDGE